MVGLVKKNPVVKMLSPLLMEWAQNNVDPAEAATDIETLCPEAYWQVVADLVAREDMVEYLAIFDPRALQHKEWLLKVADDLKRNHIVLQPVEDGDGPDGDDGEEGAEGGEAPEGSAPTPDDLNSPAAPAAPEAGGAPE